MKIKSYNLVNFEHKIKISTNIITPIFTANGKNGLNVNKCPDRSDPIAFPSEPTDDATPSIFP